MIIVDAGGRRRFGRDLDQIFLEALALRNVSHRHETFLLGYMVLKKRGDKGTGRVSFGRKIIAVGNYLPTCLNRESARTHMSGDGLPVDRLGFRDGDNSDQQFDIIIIFTPVDSHDGVSRCFSERKLMYLLVMVRGRR